MPKIIVLPIKITSGYTVYNTYIYIYTPYFPIQDVPHCQYLYHPWMKESTNCWGPCCVCHRSNECNLRPEGWLWSRQLVNKNNPFNCSKSNITTECIRIQIWVCLKIWCTKNSWFIIIILVELLFWGVYRYFQTTPFRDFWKWVFLIHPPPCCQGVPWSPVPVRNNYSSEPRVPEIQTFQWWSFGAVLRCFVELPS